MIEKSDRDKKPIYILHEDLKLHSKSLSGKQKGVLTCVISPQTIAYMKRSKTEEDIHFAAATK